MESTRPEVSDRVFPLSPGQEGMYFTQQLAPESHAYNVVIPGRLRAEVDAGALRRALQRLVDRHSQLRAAFEMRAEGPVQRIPLRQEVSFEQVDGAGWSEEELSARVHERARRPFDLARGPVFHATLFSRGARDHVLLLAMHHLVADLWACAILFDELGKLYAEERGGAPAALPKLERDYADYVRATAERLAGAEGQRLWAYWKGALAGPLPELKLPFSRPRPKARSFQGGTHRFRVGADVVSRLEALGEAEGATPSTLLMAALQALLFRYTGQGDVLVNTPVHGRPSRDLRGLVGLFINPVVVRGRPSGELTFRRFLGQLQHSAAGAVEHWAFPFGQLIERLGPASRLPLSQVQLVYQRSGRIDDAGFTAFCIGEPGARIERGGLALESFPLASQEGQIELQLAAYPLGAELALQLKYDADLFEPAAISRMADDFARLLAAAAEEPDRRLDALSLAGGQLG